MLYESILKITKKKKLKKQNNKLAKYYKQRSDEDGQINWEKMSNTNVVNFVRAISSPYPGAYTFYKNKKVRFLDCKKSSCNKKLKKMVIL